MTTALLDPSAPQIDDDSRRREFLAGGAAALLTAVNEEQVARTMAGRLERRVADLRTRLETSLGDRTVTLLRVQEAAYAPQVGDTVAGLLEELGVRRPPGQQFDPEKFPKLSLERIGELDAHAIFVYTDAGADEARRRLEARALWQRLQAVREGRVYFVEDATAWAVGVEVLGVNVVLDEIERRLA